MLFPDYKSSNGHSVSIYGRLFYTVTSASRKGLIHFVDLEKSKDWTARFLCTCESFKYGERPCRHISAVFEAMAHWAGIDPSLHGEFVDKLMFLLQMGQDFSSAIMSCIDHHRTPSKPEQPPQKAVREYKLKNRKQP